MKLFNICIWNRLRCVIQIRSIHITRTQCKHTHWWTNIHQSLLIFASISIRKLDFKNPPTPSAAMKYFMCTGLRLLYAYFQTNSIYTQFPFVFMCYPWHKEDSNGNSNSISDSDSSITESSNSVVSQTNDMVASRVMCLWLQPHVYCIYFSIHVEWGNSTKSKWKISTDPSTKDNFGIVGNLWL